MSITFVFVQAFLISAMIAFLLRLTTHWHGRWSADAPASGPQKLHSVSVPRIGGVAIAAGFVFALFSAKFGSPFGEAIASPLALCAALAVPFLAGLYEDVTKSFGAVSRLIATFVAAAIAFYFCGAKIVRFDMPLLDGLLNSMSLAPLLLTMFCVGGVAHAFNLSDGLNGLLAGLGIVGCALLAYVARAHGDTFIYVVSVILAAATSGYFLFNDPRAKLFAGDSGAYFIGTAIALLAILIVARNPGVSPWIAFAAVLYPFTDTTFTIIRRLVERQPIMQPDAKHLHSLVVRAMLANRISYANAKASAIIIMVSGAFALVAAVFASSSASVIATCVGFALSYMLAWFYCANAASRTANFASAPTRF
ncbi:MAG: MraY family glycosyltransferase [Casimicrobium sp.]